MSRLRIDFAWPRLAHRRAGLVIAACVLVSAWAWMAWRHTMLQSELDGWQSDRERLSRRESAARAPGSAADKERLQTELRLANRVIDALNRPWDDLFSAVDTARSDKATLLAVEPDTERREVRLTAEAKDLAGMLDYLKKVRATPALKNAALAEHQVSLQDAQRPVRFSILAKWSKAPPLPAAASAAPEAPPPSEPGATPVAVPKAQP
jgi:hypothetical protein